MGPVQRWALTVDGPGVRGEIGDPPVVSYKGEVPFAQLCRPSDNGASRSELSRGGAEAEHGDRPAVSVVDGVAHPGADLGLVVKIVVSGDELVSQLALADPGECLHQIDLFRPLDWERRRHFKHRKEHCVFGDRSTSSPARFKLCPEFSAILSWQTVVVNGLFAADDARGLTTCWSEDGSESIERCVSGTDRLALSSIDVFRQAGPAVTLKRACVIIVHVRNRGQLDQSCPAGGAGYRSCVMSAGC